MQPYVDAWTTALDNCWVPEAYSEGDFQAYLQSYRRAARIYLVPATAHDQPAATTDMYPIASVGGSRHHAVSTMHFICKQLS